MSFQIATKELGVYSKEMKTNRMMTVALFLSCVLSMLPSCASMIQSACNPDQAYDLGANDAMAGRRMVTAGWDACETTLDKKSEIKAAYRRGFEAARGGSHQTIIMPAQAPAPAFQVNLGGS